VDLKEPVKKLLMLVLVTSILFQSLPVSKVVGEASIQPSPPPKNWGMFFDTTGDVNITITEPGMAVKIDLPRYFLEGVIPKSNRQTVNDTSFIHSDISNDYYYYQVIDQAEYFPYDPNSPYSIVIQHPPTCDGVHTNFTAPKFVLFQGLVAPRISGVYNFTVFIAPIVDANGKPVFPALPNEVFPIQVSMREDPGSISGSIVDDKAKKFILTKGVVYAVGVNTGKIGKGFVDATTGFFNITGLYAGEYRLEGSAGFFADTGFAYAPTASITTYPVSGGGDTRISNFTLNRGGVINGSITYTDQLGAVLKPLDSPYLKALHYTGLNYTVEAYDDAGRIVASRTYKSQNIPTEQYSLTIRNGTKYVDYPALGTEFAGIGLGTYTIRVWVYGFTQPIIPSVPLTLYGYVNNIGDTRLPYGAAVSGKIRLKIGPFGTEETPNDAEAATFLTRTGRHFGGNILGELFDSGGSLRGLTVLNRTSANGTCLYADYSSGDQTQLLRFYILGFSEFLNKSYSGTWKVGAAAGPSPWDYGLEPGSYYVHLWIRGYTQEKFDTFTLGSGSNQTIYVDLRRAGSVDVGVTSAVVRPGTTFPQQPVNWRFLNLCPTPRLRVYFYGSSGSAVGFAEQVLTTASPSVTNTTASLNFTGHNWSIDDIVLRGFFPSALLGDNYDVKGYTYGYVQAQPASVSISLTPYSPTHVRMSFVLLIAGRISGSVSLQMAGSFVSLTENVAITAQVTSGGLLMGTSTFNATAGLPAFNFSTYGFFGRGHFFYVDPAGVEWNDYGLDARTYSVIIPDFGYHRRFQQQMSVSADLPELGWEVGVFFTMERLIRITGVVTGYNKDRLPVLLVWATVTTNGATSYTYDGDFYIHVPAGTYTVTFSCPGYVDQSRTVTTNDQIGVDTVLLDQSGAPFP
jgi:hypothetical protein